MKNPRVKERKIKSIVTASNELMCNDLGSNTEVYKKINASISFTFIVGVTIFN